MNFSGNQLRAARALLGLDQETLADNIGVSDNTIRNMEACGCEPVGGFTSTRDKVLEALEGMGIEFLNDGSPGVRLYKDRKAIATTRSAAPTRAPRKSARERKR
jgi:transcriptional regulator with XRE-family HTH domain